MKKLRKIKKNQKGFTLIEVIVVLVILAIMAAILVPSLVGYIDKANQNTIVTETRSIVTAVQTLASEKYAKDKDGGDYEIGKDISFDDITKLCEITVSGSNLEGNTISGRINSLTFTSSGYTCTYPGYTVTEVAE